ncbi:RNA methyltransferase [bacterium]|jgi:RNA methyltransferase, TrmH family|nr:RNA methyltransferase [bacterium]
MNKITSTANPLIKEIKKLHNKKYRKENNQFLAEGTRACTTLIDAGLELINCFCTDKIEISVKEEQKTIVSENVLKAISQAQTPSGIVCQFEIPTQKEIKNIKSGIICENISNPGNLGTLIRSAAAFNIKDIILVDGADQWSSKVVQSTAGTIGLVNIYKSDYKEINNLKDNISICALVAKDGDKPTKENIQNSFIVIGNEAHGISNEMLSMCDKKITLSMPGKAESLNASIAGSIAMYIASE